MGLVIFIWLFFSYEQPRPIAVILPIPRDNNDEEIWEFWESDISTTSSESESSSDSESSSESESEDEPPSRTRRETPLDGRNCDVACKSLILKEYLLYDISYINIVIYIRNTRNLYTKYPELLPLSLHHHTIKYETYI